MTDRGGDAAPAGQDEPVRTSGRRVEWLGIAGVALAIGAAWWWTAVHPGGQLGPPTSAGLCVTRSAGPADGDIAIGAALEPTSDVELTGLTLVGDQNVEVLDASVVPVVAGPDGGTAIVGATAWPLTSADRAGLTLDWDRERGLDGARLAAGTTENLVLHVRVTDPAAAASWSAFRVTYRTAGARWAETFDLTLLVPAGNAACPDAG